MDRLVAIWPALVLIALVAGILALNNQSALDPMFRWLPVPLWCYALPMLLTSVGWLPAQHAVYGWITDRLFPVVLGILLFGVDLRGLSRTGWRAGLAMAVGTVSIVVGGPLMAWLFRAQLPADAWKGVGTLAATWTGGSLNMLALRTVLNTPEPMFAPLVVVDALVAYSWMACLIACRGWSDPINRWLRASALEVEPTIERRTNSSTAASGLVAMALAGSIILALICRLVAQRLPRHGLITTVSGWTVLLITTLALAAAYVPAVRRAGQQGGELGYVGLYCVLAALGARANVIALTSTPVWILLGIAWLAFHAVVLLLAGRLFRLPLSLLATASQANVGGVVSAPAVAAVYHPSLAPVGLLLALAGNALGTYLGLCTATLCRWLLVR